MEMLIKLIDDLKSLEGVEFVDRIEVIRRIEEIKTEAVKVMEVTNFEIVENEVN
jgi:hypothetical protein